MNQTLTFDVSSLFHKGPGTSINYSFNGPVEFDGLKLTQDIKGDVEIMRLQDGFNCKISEVDTVVELVCSLCLEKFNQSINIEHDERIYYFKNPAKIEDPNDLFLVDIKKQEVDLTEPLRQEIILHFPQLLVCYKGCKGICPICGINRNTQSCDCKEYEPEENKPLSALKSLLKKNNG